MQDNNFSTRYRPRTFSEVVGQESAVAVLKRIASADGISCRAIFLKGSYGSGKTTLCKIFARAMNCESFRKTGDVCNECDGCKESFALNSQTYIECDATQMRSLESLNELKSRLDYPCKGRRVVVLDEIHCASREVLNGLLKLVEDGVPNTIFVFASTEDILPTIKSRSICLDITTVPAALMRQRLKHVAECEGLSVSDNIYDLICTKSLGHMRDALSYLQLYSISPEALRSSYQLFTQFMSLAWKGSPDAPKVLQQLLLYPVVDVVQSINSFLRSVFVTPEHPLHKSGAINGLFNFFYTPVAQQALKSEAGVELLLHSFIEKCLQRK